MAGGLGILNPTRNRISTNATALAASNGPLRFRQIFGLAERSSCPVMAMSAPATVLMLVLTCHLNNRSARKVSKNRARSRVLVIRPLRSAYFGQPFLGTGSHCGGGRHENHPQHDGPIPEPHIGGCPLHGLHRYRQRMDLKLRRARQYIAMMIDRHGRPGIGGA